MTNTSSRVATKWVVFGGVVVALILAGVVSFYASGSPDGLNKVALDRGFSETEEPHSAADGPFAGYSSKGIDNERLAGGIAGVVGVVVVLALSTGLAFVVRRRHDEESDAPSDANRQSTG